MDTWVNAFLNLMPALAEFENQLFEMEDKLGAIADTSSPAYLVLEAKTLSLQYYFAPMRLTFYVSFHSDLVIYPPPHRVSSAARELTEEKDKAEDVISWCYKDRTRGGNTLYFSISGRTRFLVSNRPLSCLPYTSGSSTCTKPRCTDRLSSGASHITNEDHSARLE